MTLHCIMQELSMNHHGEDRHGAGPGGDAHHVGAGQRVAQYLLEGVTRDAEGEARQRPHQYPRHTDGIHGVGRALNALPK